MLGTLNKRDLIDLLENESIGRLGCHADGETYIIPINYVYRNDAIYAHSGNGKKIEMMRSNPKVCFQVDRITDLVNWKSVIVWGVFEELKDEERQQALQGIIQRVKPLINDPAQSPSHGIKEEHYDDLVVYKINITEGSGRFESHDTQ